MKNVRFPINAFTILMICSCFALLLGTTQIRAQDLLACPAALTGYLRPLLSVGGRGEIRADGVPTRARFTPTINAGISFQIEPGTSFTVIGGPACADGYLWWRVAYGEQIGWTAESSVSERIYYFQPAPPLSDSPRAPITRETLGQVRDLGLTLPSARFSVAAFAPWAMVYGTQVPLTVLRASDPTQALAMLTTDARTSAADIDATGSRILVGGYNAATQGYFAQLYRYVPGAVTPLFSILSPILLTDAPPLVNVAISPPYLLTLHAEVDAEVGALLIWDAETGALTGRVELAMSPASLVIDGTGLVAAVSALAGANAQTVLVDLRTAEVVASAEDYGVLAWNPYPGSWREQLLIGRNDGVVVVYLALPPEAAQPLQIVPARLQRLGEVEVFVRRPDMNISVLSMAVDPRAALLAVGGGSRFDGALPEDFRAAVAFVDLETFIVDANSIRSDDWRSVDQLGFSADGTALWVGYSPREGASALGVFGVAGG
jgi:hypothetical protein